MRYCCFFVLACIVLVRASPLGHAEGLSDWPEFRGPTGQGIALDATPPLEWGPTKNIVWKQAIPGTGWSSPVVVDGVVYLTTAIQDGDEHLTSLRALAIDGATGAITWNEEVFPGTANAQKHPKNGHASPTPIVSEGRIYVHFGPLGTACLDTSGKAIWRQTGLAYDTPHGSGGSPALVDGKLLYSCDDTSKPFVVALDSETGRVAWKTMRDTEASKKFSFSTPLVIESGGRKVAVSAGSGYVSAYDPGDGSEVWRVGYGEGFSVVPRPVTSHGLVFIATGFARPSSVLAIRAGGQGDVSTTHMAWSSEEGTPHTPSMLAIGDELYFASDRGLFSCVDAETGRAHWREDVGGKFSASPVYAGGRIYATSEEGVTLVIQAGTTFKKLAENDLGERTLASTAVCGLALIMRTDGNLYRIEEQ